LRAVDWLAVRRALATAWFVLLCVTAWCQDEGVRHEFGETVSNDFHILYVAAGLLGDYWFHPGTQSNLKWNRSLRAADALLVSTAVTSVLKVTVDSSRPDTGTKGSFPSGHTSAAFALATAQAAYHPEDAPYWYFGAALIGSSRVMLGRHRWSDVIGGAVIGYASGRLAVSGRGILLTPTFGRSMGFTATWRF